MYGDRRADESSPMHVPRCLQLRILNTECKAQIKGEYFVGIVLNKVDGDVVAIWLQEISRDDTFRV